MPFLFYAPDRGMGQFFSTNGLGEFESSAEYDDWRHDWNQIVYGLYGAAGQPGLLFYESATGTGEFRTVANLSLITEYTDWNHDLTKIIDWGTPDYPAGLLIYESSTGTGQFCGVNGGQVDYLSTHDDWRTDWDIIVSGNFTQHGTGSSLLFYQRANGVGGFWGVDSHGQPTFETTYTDWRRDWWRIVPITLGWGANPGLLFYEPTGGTVGIFQVANGLITHVQTHFVSQQYREVVPDYFPSVLFYSPITGNADIFGIEENGDLPMLSANHVRDDFTIISRFA